MSASEKNVWGSHWVEARRIATLAWPIILTSLNWTIMHMVDVLVVGIAGTSELGALAAGRVVFFVAIVLLLGGMTGVVVYTSRADGAGDLPRTGGLWREALLLGLLLGIPTAVVTAIFANALLERTGVAPALVGPGADVLRAMMLGLPGQTVTIALSFFLEGVSQPRRVLQVNLVMLPVNAVLAWALALGHLGSPALGAVGAALATALTSIGGAIAMAVMCWTLPDASARTLRRRDIAAWIDAARGLPALLRFGAVPGFAAGMEVVGFSWLMILSTRMGAATAGGFQVMLSLHNIGYALALGLGSAAGVRVGNAVGAAELQTVRPRTFIACALSIAIMGGLVAVYILASGPIVDMLTSDHTVAREAAIMVAILAPFILLDGLQAIFLSALRSLGDQVAGGINGIIGFFVVMAIAGLLFWQGGWGSAGLAWAAALGMTVAAGLQALRFLWVTCSPSRSGG